MYKRQHLQGELGIGNYRPNLAFVTDDALILEQSRNILLVKGSHTLGIEPLKSSSECLTSRKNRAPGETHLERFEAEDVYKRQALPHRRARR